MKYLLLSFLLSAQICPNCFQTKWKTKTAAVECSSAPQVVREFQSEGYQVKVKVYKDEEIGKVCDILGFK